MERQSWCSHQSPVPIPLLFIILAATDTSLQVHRAFPLRRISRVSLCLRWPLRPTMHRRGPKAAPVTMQLSSHGPRPRASVRHSIRSAA